MSPEEMAQINERNRYESARRQRLYWIGLDSQCLAYGFKRNTTEFAQCLQNENALQKDHPLNK